jgi:hypothetical protein
MKALVTHLYSNPYSNADEKLQPLAIRSERRTQEWSTWRTSANAGEPVQAFPVCAIPIAYSHPYLRSSVSTGDLSRMDHGQRDALYSNRTAIGMMSIPNDYPERPYALP